ncbi:MAG: 50S ribosomal protein L30 [Acidobacteriota bacterium]
MAKAKKESGKETDSGASKILIQWYRSTIATPKSHKELVRSLGFTKLNQIVERPDSASTRGMVKKVPHLLRIVGRPDSVQTRGMAKRFPHLRRVIE